MKRVKIMLMSLLVLGVAGGALAFKVKFSAEYCTTLPRGVIGQAACAIGDAALKCRDLLENYTTTYQGQVFIVCTTTPLAGADPCPNTLNCHSLAYLTVNN